MVKIENIKNNKSISDNKDICDACHVDKCVIKKSKFGGFVKICQNSDCCFYKETLYTIPTQPNF